MITPEGYVFIFDNGNNKSKIKENYVSADRSYSRGVMYEIDTKNMTIKQVYEYGKERGSKFYSPYISDVDYIDSNHYIVHSGGIVEVDGIQSNKPAGLTSGNTKLTSDTVEVLDNKVIFELVLPTNNYRVEKMSLYSNSDELKIKRAKRLGSLGKTNVTKNEIFSLYSVKKQDNEYKKHDIKLVKEEDRLSVTGKFKRGSDVNVILYKNLKSSYYKINVSKHPYTALCVDVFTEEENKNGITVTKYINSEGLSGICIFNLSRNIKLGLNHNCKEEIRINFTPWTNDLRSFLDNFKDKKVSVICDGFMDYKLTNILYKYLGIDTNKTWNELSDFDKNKIVDALTDFKVDIKDTKGYLDAQVTCGGVCLNEINLNDMSSKFVNNLYFIGEVLDLDGDCGGYNLTIAFITGLLAGGNND